MITLIFWIAGWRSCIFFVTALCSAQSTAQRSSAFCNFLHWLIAGGVGVPIMTNHDSGQDEAHSKSN